MITEELVVAFALVGGFLAVGLWILMEPGQGPRRREPRRFRDLRRKIL